MSCQYLVRDVVFDSHILSPTNPVLRRYRIIFNVFESDHSAPDSDDSDDQDNHPLSFISFSVPEEIVPTHEAQQQLIHSISFSYPTINETGTPVQSPSITPSEVQRRTVKDTIVFQLHFSHVTHLNGLLAFEFFWHPPSFYYILKEGKDGVDGLLQRRCTFTNPLLVGWKRTHVTFSDMFPGTLLMNMAPRATRDIVLEEAPIPHLFHTPVLDVCTHTARTQVAPSAMLFENPFPFPLENKLPVQFHTADGRFVRLEVVYGPLQEKMTLLLYPSDYNPYPVNVDITGSERMSGAQHRLLAPTTGKLRAQINMIKTMGYEFKPECSSPFFVLKQTREQFETSTLSDTLPRHTWWYTIDHVFSQITFFRKSYFQIITVKPKWFTDFNFCTLYREARDPTDLFKEAQNKLILYNPALSTSLSDEELRKFLTLSRTLCVRTVMRNNYARKCASTQEHLAFWRAAITVHQMVEGGVDSRELFKQTCMERAQHCITKIATLKEEYQNAEISLAEEFSRFYNTILRLQVSAVRAPSTPAGVQTLRAYFEQVNELSSPTPLIFVKGEVTAETIYNEHNAVLEKYEFNAHKFFLAVLFKLQKHQEKQSRDRPSLVVFKPRYSDLYESPLLDSVTSDEKEKEEEPFSPPKTNDATSDFRVQCVSALFENMRKSPHKIYYDKLLKRKELQWNIKGEKRVRPFDSQDCPATLKSQCASTSPPSTSVLDDQPHPEDHANGDDDDDDDNPNTTPQSIRPELE